jgi:hypothetical protein
MPLRVVRRCSIAIVEREEQIMDNSTFSQNWYTLVEGQVSMTTVVGHLTTETMRQNDRDFTAFIDASSAPMVHLIVDTRRMLSVPPISENRKAGFPYHPRMGYNVTIGAFRNPFVRLIITMSVAVIRIRYKDVDSLEEACAFLISKDSDLPPLEMWALPNERPVAGT